MVKISIIIPVYNTAKFLRRCLDSVLNQTFTDWQAICVNDGSTDNSGEILAQYVAQDSRFVIINQENSGQSHARNVGTVASNGEYIIYLDSDDFVHPQLLEIVYHMMNAHSADMLSFGYDVRFYRRLTMLLKHGINIDGILPDSRNKVYNLHRIPYFITNNILAHSTERNHTWFSWRPVRRHCYPVLCMYRRKLIENLLFIRGIIFEDFPWWSAVMLRRPRTVMIRTPLYFYMPNATSSLNSSRARRMIESVAVGLRSAYDVVNKYATPSEYKRFNKEFLWPFAIILMRKVRDLDNDTDKNVARDALRKLYDTGMFDMTTSRRARRYINRIRRFIAEN